MTGGATMDAVVFGLQFLGAVTARIFDPQFLYRTRRTVALTATAGLIGSLRYGYWAGAGFCAGTLVLLACDWWNRRGRKAARKLGEKSRAALAAIVERMREAGKPVPQGVRA